MESTNRTSKMTRLGLLMAIIVLMAYTPLGYLQIGLFLVTFLTIPVIIGAVTMGPLEGAFLGLIFGITSFAKAFNDPMGVTFLTINPFYTFILCIIPRILIGYLSGIIFKALNKNKNFKLWKVSIASLSCPLLNTILYMSTLVILFGNTDYIQNLRGGTNIFVFVATFVGVQAIVEALVCTMIGTVISMALIKAIKSGK